MITTTQARLARALSALWPDAEALPRLADDDAPLALCLDSRAIADCPHAAVFIAVPGVSADGRRFIAQAQAAGAAWTLADADQAEDGGETERVLWLSELAERLGELGRLLFVVPESLTLIGVTGTNGKSSVTHYIAALSEALGHPAGVIGTLGWGRHGGELADSGQTTPGALELQAALGQLSERGVERVAIEVSSHALMQQRLNGCRLDVAVYTNLSRDHLDYHGSMAAYAAAKARLFRRSELKLAVVNGDDPLARLMLAGLPPDTRVLASGTQEATTLRVLDWLPHASGQRALIATPDGERVLELKLMGRFNLDNVLLAMATLMGLGEDLDELCAAAESLAPVPGRMQCLSRPGAPSVVVDYAHTPDALRHALEALRAHLPGRDDGDSEHVGRLWCVFGCGGDRDSGKRALMGAAVEANADRWIITDDNPRSEDPARIREQILAGLSAPARESAWCVAGRERAIERAIAAAGPDDVILIAGKGHEAYQEIQGQRLAFSDCACAEAVLARWQEGAS